jgi:hypothetical protein
MNRYCSLLFFLLVFVAHEANAQTVYDFEEKFYWTPSGGNGVDATITVKIKYWIFGGPANTVVAKIEKGRRIFYQGDEYTVDQIGEEAWKDISFSPLDVSAAIHDHAGRYRSTVIFKNVIEFDPAALSTWEEVFPGVNANDAREIFQNGFTISSIRFRGLTVNGGSMSGVRRVVEQKGQAEKDHAIISKAQRNLSSNTPAILEDLRKELRTISYASSYRQQRDDLIAQIDAKLGNMNTNQQLTQKLHEAEISSYSNDIAELRKARNLLNEVINHESADGPMKAKAQGLLQNVNRRAQELATSSSASGSDNNQATAQQEQQRRDDEARRRREEAQRKEQEEREVREAKEREDQASRAVSSRRMCDDLRRRGDTEAAIRCYENHKRAYYCGDCDDIITNLRTNAIASSVGQAYGSAITLFDDNSDATFKSLGFISGLHKEEFAAYFSVEWQSFGYLYLSPLTIALGTAVNYDYPSYQQYKEVISSWYGSLGLCLRFFDDMDFKLGIGGGVGLSNMYLFIQAEDKPITVRYYWFPEASLSFGDYNKWEFGIQMLKGKLPYRNDADYYGDNVIDKMDIDHFRVFLGYKWQ